VDLLRRLLINLYAGCGLHRLIEKFIAFHQHSVAAAFAHKYKTKINFIRQGEGGLYITGHGSLTIGPHSHLKSNTYIDCSGGVEIGDYLHTGRGLTILSSNHDYDSNESIPYGKESILNKVVIEDFVWLGAAVTILPGVRIGQGAVIGAGSMVSKDIPPYAIATGVPQDREKSAM